MSSIQSKHIEKICAYLNCEPNDLYEWKPDKDTVNVEAHPLKGLRREGTTMSYTEMIRNIPLDKVAEIETLLAGLQTSE